jgi:hypothetical protein
MSICSHDGERRYTRRVFANGTVHICIQCMDCLDVVLSPLHAMRPWIRLDEVPAGQVIHEWIDSEHAVRQEGLF